MRTPRSCSDQTELSCASASQPARASTTCCPRPSPSCARPRAASLGLRHFDVQLIGGMALHEGQIAEMKTGEGKTLVSTLAGYLNALAGKGVHIVTVNDYLAKRDSEWMGHIYRFLRLEVGLLQNGMPLDQKRRAYDADVTYGTNSEFGFDYLRDNMVICAQSARSARPRIRHRRRG
ncbi:MAG: hypothetical protein ACLTSX_02960 [Collinsella sp.]